MGRKTVKTTASGLNQFIGKQGLAPLDTEEVTELGQYFPSSGGGSGFEPTEEQLEAMNSGITAAKVAAYDTLPDEDNVKDLISDHFVAGTNVTITDNQDGTQTISSTASGGTSDYSDLSNKPSINNVTLSGNKTTADLGISEVPAVTASDDRKFLKALYDSSDVNYEWSELPVYQEVPTVSVSDNGKVLTATVTGSDPAVPSYEWAELPSVDEVPDVTSSDNGKILTAAYSGGTGSYAWGNLPSVDEVPDVTSSDDGKVLTATYSGSTGTYAWAAPPTPTAPTAYTETLTGRSWSIGSSSFKSVVSDGGFVVVDNICTFNIYVTFTLTGSNSLSIPGDKKIIYGFPTPCNTGPVPRFMGMDNQSTPVTFQCSIDTNGDLQVNYTSTNLKAAGFYLTGSYLVDTST